MKIIFKKLIILIVVLFSLPSFALSDEVHFYAFTQFDSKSKITSKDLTALLSKIYKDIVTNRVGKEKERPTVPADVYGKYFRPSAGTTLCVFADSRYCGVVTPIKFYVDALFDDPRELQPHFAVDGKGRAPECARGGVCVSLPQTVTSANIMNENNENTEESYYGELSLKELTNLTGGFKEAKNYQTNYFVEKSLGFEKRNFKFIQLKPTNKGRGFVFLYQCGNHRGAMPDYYFDQYFKISGILYFVVRNGWPGGQECKIFRVDDGKITEVYQAAEGNEA